jgi:HSP20 family protein
MMIMRWQPFHEVETLRSKIDQVFDELKSVTNNRSETWSPAIELQDSPENLILRVQLPGINRKDLDIQVTREAVLIAGERPYEKGQEDRGYFRSEFYYGKFHRVVELPLPVRHDQVKAEFSNGVLTLILPKLEKERDRVVKINLAELACATQTTSLEAASDSVAETSRHTELVTA